MVAAEERTVVPVVKVMVRMVEVATEEEESAVAARVAAVMAAVTWVGVA